MNVTAERLYRLLPAYYRQRDAEQGEPLKALVTVIAKQAAGVEGDIAQLYENWFIETCGEWVVPYIGDMLGVRGLHFDKERAAFSRRAYVANTLRYRRRKGTAPVLEQLAFDTTGWRARAVEFFETLGTTQNCNHIRPHNLHTPDLRHTNALEMLNTAFDTIGHTVDVRSIALGRGRHNIHNIGLFVWRLQSYPLTRVTARPVNGGYSLNPLGKDLHLFNRPQTESQITHLAEEINVPGLLRRRPLYDELEARRQAGVDGQTPENGYFDGSEKGEDVNSVLEVFINGATKPIPPAEVLICNLQNWDIPPDEKTYKRIENEGSISEVQCPVTVAVDPCLGRLVFPATLTVTQVQVSYAFGFSGDVGGGPYDRSASVFEVLKGKVDWQVGVSNEIVTGTGTIFKTLTEAVEKWNEQPAGTVGVIVIMDSHTYDEDITGGNRIKVPEGSRLAIIGAGWPEEEGAGGVEGEKQRSPGRLTPVDCRPHILGGLEVEGTADSTSLVGGELVIDGLLVEGKFTVLGGNLSRLRVSHCTLVPEYGGIEVSTVNEHLNIALVRSICGPVKLTVPVSSLSVEESIIDNSGGYAITADATGVELQKCTVFGLVDALKIDAGNCIFTEKVTAHHQQAGCIRFCFLPYDSKTPRRFRCQPDLALKNSEPSDENKIRARLVPSFTAERYGHHGYAQLSRTCAEEICSGAEDGSEMGVFGILQQPQRIANLRSSLDEYLRLGLEAGIIFVT